MTKSQTEIKMNKNDRHTVFIIIIIITQLNY